MESTLSEFHHVKSKVLFLAKLMLHGWGIRSVKTKSVIFVLFLLNVTDAQAPTSEKYPLDSPCTCRRVEGFGPQVNCTRLESSRSLRTLTIIKCQVKKVRGLRVSGFAGETFNLADLHAFRALETFTLVQSPVVSLESTFPEEVGGVKIVNLSRLHLEAIPNFSDLRLLRILDLSYNRLKELDADELRRLPNATKVYLKGNTLNCTDDLFWLLDTEDYAVQKLVDLDELQCRGTYEGKPALQVLSLLKNFENNCLNMVPYNCTCSISKILRMEDGLFPVTSINCSSRSIEELPATLPPNTTTLDLRNNKISDLKPLVNNVNYGSVHNLYLDNNEISSIDVLEGSNWLLNFRLLSLRGNHLTQLHAYALDNAFQKNKNVLHVSLGNNPWICDCVFTPSFQTLIAKYQRLVKDIKDIRCRVIEGDENSKVLINELSRTDMCDMRDGINVLDLVNGILASLIILIVGKLGYDYYTFKKTGKLPWIVSKMP